MANARPRLKKRRIIMSKTQEDKGDLQISLTEAKFRLTPKLFVTIALLIVAVVSIVVVAKRYSGRQGAAPAPGAASVGGSEEVTAQAPAENQSPQVISAVITPENPDASSPLDVTYHAVDQDGHPVTCTFRWFVNDTQVQDGPSNVLQPGFYRSGDLVYAELTPADASREGATFKTASIKIRASAPVVDGVTIAPATASISDVLTAAPAGVERVSGGFSFRYQWYVNGDAATDFVPDNTFATRSLRKHDTVYVVMQASDGQVSSGSVRSNVVLLENRKPEILSSPPDSPQGGSYIYQVVAKDPDGDVLKYRLDRAPGGMTINESSGLIQWQLQKATLYAGRNEAAVRVTVDDGDGGTASQDFTVVFTDLFVP